MRNGHAEPSKLKIKIQHNKNDEHIHETNERKYIRAMMTTAS